MTIQKVIEQCLKESPCEVDIRSNEPMKDHTTFKVGGNADFFISPKSDDCIPFYISLLTLALKEKIPLFILGGGANIVVSDKGIRGIVLDMSSWKGECPGDSSEKDILIFKSGTSIDEAVDTACEYAYSGLEFLAGMPGTIGGAVWMNARCYSSEIADVLRYVEILCIEENNYLIKRIDVKNGAGFSYKKSPFQEMDCLIISAAFNLKKGNKEKILSSMEENREDRLKKGHYLFPSAGSAFKNNRDFGKPTGQIIDELGLKGFKIGGAQIAPFHGNIVINTGDASASDIRTLMNEIAAKVKKDTGFILEPEVLFTGDWN